MASKSRESHEDCRHWRYRPHRNEACGNQTSWPRASWLRTPARQPRSSRPSVGCRRRSCAAPSNAYARIAMRTSRSRPWLRTPACRASTSAAPSRKAPGFRVMPGCASTGSTSPCRCWATRRLGRVGRSGAWLCLPNCHCRGVQEANRRNPERAPTTRVGSIALQARQFTRQA